ncbi:Proline iminopeptidase [Mycoplasmopsis columbina]|nr:Proline iminopeptidase [Mycoplasmopsis columbina]
MEKAPLFFYNMLMKTYEKYLYPEIEPYEKGFYDTKDGHQIYYEISGNPHGVPILYIHGGPGGGTSKNSRRFFNPEYYKIVVFDQRGCGKSQPSLSLKNNNSNKLVEDIENLRVFLNIKEWILFGGSWGSTLSLLYALKYPNNVSKMILRGIFLARQSDVDWLYQEGASYMKPIEFAKFTSILSSEERNNIVESYYKIMNYGTEKEKEIAFREWSRWETSLVSINQMNFDENDKKGNAEISLLENYYFYNKTFIPENYILDNIKIIQHIETFIVHGEYDLDCRPSSAYELHQKMLNSQLFIIKKAAHTIGDYKITKKLVEITNSLVK